MLNRYKLTTDRQTEHNSVFFGYAKNILGVFRPWFARGRDAPIFFSSIGKITEIERKRYAGGANIMKKQILAMLLAVVVMAGLLPTTTAFAAESGKDIQLGTSGIFGYDSTSNSYDYIYMGYWNAPDSNTQSGEIKWRVLDDQTSTGETGLFLLSEALLGSGTYGGVYFQKDMHQHENGDEAPYYKGGKCENNSCGNSFANIWQGSSAQAWCKEFGDNNFSAAELGAILQTTKTDNAVSAPPLGTVSLNAEKIFFLSAEEALNPAYGFSNSYSVNDQNRVGYYGGKTQSWWLRSPQTNTSDYVGVVTAKFDNGSGNDGRVLVGGMKDDWTARPAFNLDTSKVLFTSAATNGKTAGALGTLTAPAAYSGNEWKLTLKDSSHTLTSATTSSELTAGGTISVSYTGASTNHTLSAVVVKKDTSEVVYYGKLVESIAAADGTVNLTLPNDFDSTTMTVKLFTETLNGNNKTDYASELVELAVHAHTWNTVWASNETHHWHEPTCDCTIADTDKDGYAAHTYDKEVVSDTYKVSDANCTAPATYYKSCVCGKAGTETFTSGQAAGHNYGTDWKSDAQNHWHECSCGAKSDEAAHTAGDWIVDKAATATEKGSKHKECTVCGYTTETAEIPATGTTNPTVPDDKDDTTKPSEDNNPNTGADEVPKTGDNSNMALWLSLMFASICGFIVLLFVGKKSKSER